MEVADITWDTATAPWLRQGLPALWVGGFFCHTVPDRTPPNTDTHRGVGEEDMAPCTQEPAPFSANFLMLSATLFTRLTAQGGMKGRRESGHRNERVGELGWVPSKCLSLLFSPLHLWLSLCVKWVPVQLWAIQTVNGALGVQIETIFQLTRGSKEGRGRRVERTGREETQHGGQSTVHGVSAGTP